MHFNFGPVTVCFQIIGFLDFLPLRLLGQYSDIRIHLYLQSHCKLPFASK